MSKIVKNFIQRKNRYNIDYLCAFNFCNIADDTFDNGQNAWEQTKLHISSEVLINLVKSKPCLWNKSLSEYKGKMCRDEAWTEIYRALVPGFDKLKSTNKRQIGIQVNKKWCNIRDAYVKARNNYRLHKTNRPYVHTKMLSFLNPFISEKSTGQESRSSNKIEGDDEDDTEGEAEIEGKSDETDNWYNETVYLEEIDEPEAKKPKIEMEYERDMDDNNTSNIEIEPKNVIGVLTKMIQREHNDDIAFFKSIEPSVKRLSEDSKLEFRIHVLNLIKELRQRDRNLQMTDGNSSS